MVDIERTPARNAVFGGPKPQAQTETVEPPPETPSESSGHDFGFFLPRPAALLKDDGSIVYANAAFSASFGEGKSNISDVFPQVARRLDEVAARRELRIPLREGARGQEVYAFSVTGHPEATIGVILRAFVTLEVSELREKSARMLPAAQSMASMADTLSSTSEEISAAIQQVARGAQDQAQRVEETVRTVKHMADEIARISQSVQRAQEASASATQNALTGQESARKAITKLSDMRDNVEGAAQRVRGLGERSQEIQEIVGSITNITQQTNLLALNAAIEAARAGEHGRGFAVVAEEVRKLAESSRRAAETIVDLTQQISSDIDQVVVKIEDGTRDVHESTEIVTEALNSLGEIATEIQSTDEIIQEISRATDAQKMGAETIVKAVDEVAVIAEETSSSTEETAASVEELTSSMEELTVSVHELVGISNELSALLNTEEEGGSDQPSQ